jgi:nuclear pore complex protein Nup93
LPLVQSFVSAQQISRTAGLEDDLVEGEPVWPLIFYCLPCGDVNEALQATKQGGYRAKLYLTLQQLHIREFNNSFTL